MWWQGSVTPQSHITGRIVAKLLSLLPPLIFLLVLLLSSAVSTASSSESSSSTSSIKPLMSITIPQSASPSVRSPRTGGGAAYAALMSWPGKISATSNVAALPSESAPMSYAYTPPKSTPYLSSPLLLLLLHHTLPLPPTNSDQSQLFHMPWSPQNPVFSQFPNVPICYTKSIQAPKSVQLCVAVWPV